MKPVGRRLKVHACKPPSCFGVSPRSIDDPLLSLHINILGTTNVFFAAKEEGLNELSLPRARLYMALMKPFLR